jgi:diguanylate cyclase (GGDEF)-like protein
MSGTGFGSALMARALAALFGAGATLALLTVLLPHSPHANDAALLAIVANAYVVAAVLYGSARSISPRVIRAALAWGSTLIAAVAYFSAQAPSPLIFFFLWVFLYSAYFMSSRETAFQIAYVGLAYGALLIARPPHEGVAAWWIVGMGTLLVAAILIRAMRQRVESLIAKLYDAARTDPLTNLSNRRGFRELLDLELERARRAEGRMTLMLVDLDSFKEVNDRCGQAVGDSALRRIASLLETNKRQLDAIARVGGEEFALVLPDTDQHEAFAIAETLRNRIREEFAADAVPITASFGLASYPEHGATAASLIHAADEALQAAKEGGRDRTVLHSHALRAASQEASARDVAGERFVSVVLDLAEAVDLRFSGSARHSETVGRYAEMMGRELGLPEKRVARLRLAGILHDVGKVAVPDAILQKPARLTDEEFEVIKRHPGLGEQILEHPSLADVRTWVGAHHERPDGRGYPRGLRDEEIDLEAQILAVADAYEAMTSDRAYRASLGQAAACEELERCAGTQFDAHVVDALLAVMSREAQRADALLART